MIAVVADYLLLALLLEKTIGRPHVGGGDQLLQFIEQGGSKSVITEATKLEDKKFGTKITLEYED